MRRSSTPSCAPVPRARAATPSRCAALLAAAMFLGGVLPGCEAPPPGEPAVEAPQGEGSREAGSSAKNAAPAEKAPVPPALDFTVKDIDGKEVFLGSYLGKVLLVVNVASRCGLTEKQYAGLEPLYEKYRDRGFEILAFPANNFLAQEPGTDREIKAFCAAKGVTFKLFSKISVKGEDIHPLYAYLTSPRTGGAFSGDIRWNFDKFLIDSKGQVAARFAPKVLPLSGDVTSAVEKALAGRDAARGRP